MTDLLLRLGVDNLCISLALALVAFAVQAVGRRPRVAYLLWLLVLVKLLTPPILTLPVVAVPGLSSSAADPLAGLAVAPPPMQFGTGLLVLIWLAGSAWVLTGSLARIYRFHRLLVSATEAAPPEFQDLASGIARRLGLRRAPTIYTTSANLSPMVWWIGGSVRVLVPAALAREMGRESFRWVLAHELAHVRRRDHLIRWLEWLACIAFWWNPVAWWARRGLRANEEICCDALVLESLNPDPRAYGNALLTAVEFLAAPPLRAPAMASEMTGGGFLERRFRMIADATPLRRTPPCYSALLLLFAVAVLPLGVAYGRNAGVGEPARTRTAAVTEKIWADVRADEQSDEDAGVRWEAYLKSLR